VSAGKGTRSLHSCFKNFSRYITNMAQNGEGMIETTWFGASKKDPQAVQRIINISAASFWNAK